MPQRKRQKTERAVNWDESDNEESSSSEGEEEVVAQQEEGEEEGEGEGEEAKSANDASDQKKKEASNPYLLTKGEGRFREDRSVFIGQLPKETTAPQVRALFSRSGEISRTVIMKFKDTGRPMGSAFIEFDQVEGAEHAVTRNGESYKGRMLRINMSNSKPSKPVGPSNTSGGSSGVSSRDKDGRLVYVGNLNFKTERAQLIQFFKKCGKIQSIDLPVWRDSGKKRGFAMVEFLSPNSISHALKLDGNELDGRPVVVQLRSDNRGTKPFKETPQVTRKRLRNER